MMKVFLTLYRFELFLLMQNKNQQSVYFFIFNTRELSVERKDLQLLCILTSKRVLRMPFAGQNRLSDAKTIIAVTKGTK